MNDRLRKKNSEQTRFFIILWAFFLSMHDKSKYWFWVKFSELSFWWNNTFWALLNQKKERKKTFLTIGLWLCVCLCLCRSVCLYVCERERVCYQHNSKTNCSTNFKFCIRSIHLRSYLKKLLGEVTWNFLSTSMQRHTKEFEYISS